MPKHTTPAVTHGQELTYRDYARDLPTGVTFICGNEFSVSVDNEPFTVKLKSHRRAKYPGNIRLRRSHRDVVISMPAVQQLLPAWNERYLTQMLSRMIMFVVDKRKWIIDQINGWTDALPFIPGIKIPYFGGQAMLVRDDLISDGLIEEQGTVNDDYALIFANGSKKKVRNAPQTPSSQFRTNVTRMLKEALHFKLSTFVKRASQILNVDTITHIDITTSRNNRWWGRSTLYKSRNSGFLQFNWRLIAFPDNVLWTIASHEVAHQHEMNHSKRFWELVERCDPDYEVNHAQLNSDNPISNQAINLDCGY